LRLRYARSLQHKCRAGQQNERNPHRARFHISAPAE
jgi:hypothetical protein